MMNIIAPVHCYFFFFRSRGSYRLKHRVNLEQLWVCDLKSEDDEGCEDEDGHVHPKKTVVLAWSVSLCLLTFRWVDETWIFRTECERVSRTKLILCGFIREEIKRVHIHTETKTIALRSWLYSVRFARVEVFKSWSSFVNGNIFVSMKTVSFPLKFDSIVL